MFTEYINLQYIHKNIIFMKYNCIHMKTLTKNTDSINETQRPRFPSMFRIVRFFPVGLYGLLFPYLSIWST